MRTTIHLPDGLWQEAKAYGLSSGKPLIAVIENALPESLACQQRDRSPRSHVRLTTVFGQSFRPGVDLDDSAALSELMQANSDPA